MLSEILEKLDAQSDNAQLELLASCLPTPCQEIPHYISQSIGNNPIIPFAALLSIISFLTQHLGYIETNVPGLSKIPLSCATLIIAESGEGKTATLNILLKTIRDWDTHYFSSEEELEDSEDIAEATKKNAKKIVAKILNSRKESFSWEEINKMAKTTQLSHRAIVDDPDPNALKNAFNKANKSLLYVNDEAEPSLLLKNIKKALATVANHWNCHANRKQNLSALITLLPETFLKKIWFSKDNFNADILSRLSIACVPRGFNPIPKNGNMEDDGILEKYNAVSDALMDSRRRVVKRKENTFKLSPETKQLWQTFHKELTEGCNSTYKQVKPFALKTAEHALRRSAAFTAFENALELEEGRDIVITAETFQRAATIALAQLEHVRMMRDFSTETSFYHETILRAVQKAFILNKKEPVTLNKIEHSCVMTSSRKVADIEKALKALIKMKLVKTVKHGYKFRYAPLVERGDREKQLSWLS